MGSELLNEVTKIKVTPVTGSYEDAPIAARTMVTFIFNIERHGELVRQPPQQKGLLSLFSDDNTRDIYWCVFFKFLCKFLLTTPTEVVMTELMGFLESWCDGDQVLEDGATFEEEKERQEIYTHHLASQVALETATASAAAVPETDAAAAAATADLDPASAYADPPGAGVPAVDAPAPFDVLTHFLTD